MTGNPPASPGKHPVATQAALISTLARGVLNAELDWHLIGAGVLVGLAIFRSPSLHRAHVMLAGLAGLSGFTWNATPYSIGGNEWKLLLPILAVVLWCPNRQAIMQWYRTYAKQTNDILDLQSSVVVEHWGLLLCCAGILGGVFAGVISDRVFQSRRGPITSRGSS